MAHAMEKHASNDFALIRYSDDYDICLVVQCTRKPAACSIGCWARDMGVAASQVVLLNVIASQSIKHVCVYDRR